MEKAFSRGKTGKRANEIECPEKGKGKAPNLKSRARFYNVFMPLVDVTQELGPTEFRRGSHLQGPCQDDVPESGRAARPSGAAS